MAITKRTVNRILGVMQSICTIKNMEHYVIGYSSAPANKRAVATARVGLPFLVVLADRLSRNDALKLEEKLFIAATKTEKKKGLLYKKYHPDKRDGRYFPSYGGNKVDPNDLVHSVYMDWCVKGA